MIQRSVALTQPRSRLDRTHYEADGACNSVVHRLSEREPGGDGGRERASRTVRVSRLDTGPPSPPGSRSESRCPTLLHAPSASSCVRSSRLRGSVEATGP